ncbi:hypothetical protein CEXT_358351 [Caerostris extrusa]|uniref:Uncharacterized protein n=1 Tax=Caerostris extrusa TaxID=172846 RepID=A0AAV4NEX5_CAEEX|nr:hypothetical protein CEXT_358351 [Caerostris extrusa]
MQSFQRGFEGTDSENVNLERVAFDTLDARFDDCGDRAETGNYRLTLGHTKQSANPKQNYFKQSAYDQRCEALKKGT